MVRPLLFAWLLLGLSGTGTSCQQPVPRATQRTEIQYRQFRDSVLSVDTGAPQPVNLFDERLFVPGQDSLRPLLIKIDSALHRENDLLQHLDSLTRRLDKKPGFSPAEQQAIRENIREVESYLNARDSTPASSCREKTCVLYAEINKSRQRLYLYLLGELKDSFKVSTGKGKEYETPAMSRHPAGPLMIKYTSKKFPGGDYKGLGNMPYAVFISSGYAIHGTTPGNFSKLGHKASHGCIRLHPDDAKVFHALVKTIGLKNTWVKVE